MADNQKANEGMVEAKLQQQGASKSLAGAVADAAAKGGLNRHDVSHNDFSGSILVWVSDVPDVLHERLTGMGFEKNEMMSGGGVKRYDDKK